MRGIQGKPGWFWLFLLEGLLTFLIGLIVSFRYSCLLWDNLLTFSRAFSISPAHPLIPKVFFVPGPGIQKGKR